MKKCLTLILVLVVCMMGPGAALAAAPSIADTLNVATQVSGGGTSVVTFTYTVPSGSNQVLVVMSEDNSSAAPTITQNGASLTVLSANMNGCSNVSANAWIAYLVAPTSGTLSYTKGGGVSLTDFSVFTVNNARQTNPIDAWTCHGATSVTTIGVSTTTPSANDLLVDRMGISGAFTVGSHGSGQTEWNNSNDSATFIGIYGSYVTGSSTPAQSQTTSENWGATVTVALQLVAIAPVTAVAVSTPPTPVVWFW